MSNNIKSVLLLRFRINAPYISGRSGNRYSHVLGRLFAVLLLLLCCRAAAQ